MDYIISSGAAAPLTYQDVTMTTTTGTTGNYAEARDKDMRILARVYIVDLRTDEVKEVPALVAGLHCRPTNG